MDEFDNNQNNVPYVDKSISELWNCLMPALGSADSENEGSAVSRRKFLLLAAASVIMSRLAPADASDTSSQNMPYRKLGKTGVKVSSIGLGGFHIGTQDTYEESARIIHSAIDNGINFMDNCWDYNDGESERRMGKALQNGYRDKVFLMTKIDGRDAQSAARQIDESLQRLQTNHIDLVQFHEIIRMNDPQRVFEKGGALEAAVKAKQQGKIRFIGFTGHKNPHIHLKMLEVADANGFAFDTVQMPLNVMDAHFESFEKLVVPVLVKKNIGILGMKSMGGGVLLKSKAVTPLECLHYALSLPTSVVITGCDSEEILDQALRAARAFKPLSATERKQLLDKTSTYATKGQFELYKTSTHFDGTVKHPEWLG